MKSTASAIVHFFGETEASIEFSDALQHTPESKERELLLLIHSLLRTLSNLKGTPSFYTFQEELSDYGSAFHERIWWPNPERPTLIHHHSEFEGKRMIGLFLGSNPLRFKYQTFGFGFFGKEIYSYAPFAMHLLIKYLSEKRSGDSDYQMALRRAIQGSFEATNGTLSLHHPLLVVGILRYATDHEVDTDS